MEMWARRGVFIAATGKNNTRIWINTPKSLHPALMGQHDSLISAYNPNYFLSFLILLAETTASLQILITERKIPLIR
jgi:hypothetical protein